MEITEYLRMRRRRLWVLAAVPLASGAAVGAYVLLGQPAMYSASAVVAAPALVGGSNQYAGAQAVTQYVSAFEAAATSSVVAGEVAGANHMSTSTVADNTTVTQVGTSPIMKVTFQNQHPKIVAGVAKSVAAQTLRYLFDSQVTLAQGAVDRAQAAVDSLAAQMAAVGKTVSALNPDQLYQSVQQQIINLEQQQVQQRANGNLTGAAAIASQISSVRVQLNALAPTVQKYDALAQRHDDARTVLAAATQSLSQARTQQAAADPNLVLRATPATKASRLPALVQKVAPAVGAGLFLAVLLLAMLELLSRRESQAEPTSMPTPRRQLGIAETNGAADRVNGGTHHASAVGGPANS